MQKSKLQVKIQKFSRLFLSLSIVLLISAGCNKAVQSTVVNPNEEARQQIQVSQKVEGDMSDQLFNFYADENKTALDLLKSSHQVQTKSFGSAGEFVESINGKAADSKKEFWAFYVSGKQANEGASSYHPKDKDKIEWKLEAIKN